MQSTLSAWPLLLLHTTFSAVNSARSPAGQSILKLPTMNKYCTNTSAALHTSPAVTACTACCVLRAALLLLLARIGCLPLLIPVALCVKAVLGVLLAAPSAAAAGAAAAAAGGAGAAAAAAALFSTQVKCAIALIAASTAAAATQNTTTIAAGAMHLAHSKLPRMPKPGAHTAAANRMRQQQHVSTQ
jgi:hypothetical protein